MRFIVLSRHYRSPLNWQPVLLDQAVSSLLSLKTFLAWLDQSDSEGKISKDLNLTLKNFSKNFTSSLDDDLNTPKALAEIFKLLNLIFKSKELNKSEAELTKKILIEKLAILGLDFTFLPLPPKIKELINQREEFRTSRDFKEADILRDKIIKQGYIIEDTNLKPIIILNDLKK